jgi:hypothetical protein
VHSPACLYCASLKGTPEECMGIALRAVIPQFNWVKCSEFGENFAAFFSACFSLDLKKYFYLFGVCTFGFSACSINLY